MIRTSADLYRSLPANPYEAECREIAQRMTTAELEAAVILDRARPSLLAPMSNADVERGHILGDAYAHELRQRRDQAAQELANARAAGASWSYSGLPSASE